MKIDVPAKCHFKTGTCGSPFGVYMKAALQYMLWCFVTTPSVTGGVTWGYEAFLFVSVGLVVSRALQIESTKTWSVSNVAGSMLQNIQMLFRNITLLRCWSSEALIKLVKRGFGKIREAPCTWWSTSLVARWSHGWGLPLTMWYFTFSMTRFLTGYFSILVFCSITI